MVYRWREKIYIKTLNRLKAEHFPFLFYKYHKLFYHSLIFRGRKLWAASFLIQVKRAIKKIVNYSPTSIFFISLITLTPNVILMPIKLGGQVEKVAMPILPKKRFTFAVKWAIKLLRDKHRTLKVKLVADNLVDALSGKGLGFEEKQRTYNIANKNRYLLRFFR